MSDGEALYRSDRVGSEEKSKMIEILKRQKEEAENQDFEDISSGIEELDMDGDIDVEQVLQMMDKDEREAFERAVKENTLVQNIRDTIEPWVSEVDIL